MNKIPLAFSWLLREAADDFPERLKNCIQLAFKNSLNKATQNFAFVSCGVS